MTKESLLLQGRRLSRVVRDGTRLIKILDNVDVDIAAGERVALLGPSGSGKSTLLHILGALEPDYQGTVRIEEQTLETLSDAKCAQLRNQTFGFVFQAYNLMGHLDARDNVLLPARFSGYPADVMRAQHVLDQVGLGSKMHQKPSTLSGGERQRVAIARALYNKPKLVFCDEPTGNLDTKTGAEILRLFTELSSQNVALLIATHDQNIAQTASRTIFINQGQLKT